MKKLGLKFNLGLAQIGLQTTKPRFQTLFIDLNPTIQCKRVMNIDTLLLKLH